MHRRTLLKSLPLGLVAPCLAPLLPAAGALVVHFGMKDRTLIEAGVDQRGRWEYILA